MPPTAKLQTLFLWPHEQQVGFYFMFVNIHHDMDEQGVNEQELRKPLNASPRMLDAQVDLGRKFSLRKMLCIFTLLTDFAVIWVWKSSKGGHRTALHIDQTSCTLCHLRNRLSSRVTCRLPCSGAMSIAVQARKEVGVRFAKVKAYEKPSAKYYGWLTSDELLNLGKASFLQSVSNYVAKQLKEFTHGCQTTDWDDAGLTVHFYEGSRTNCHEQQQPESVGQTD